MKRLLRFIDACAVFGLLDRYTWRQLFPPFRGWEGACGYCSREAEAVKRGKCARGKSMNYEGCGI